MCIRDRSHIIVHRVRRAREDDTLGLPCKIRHLLRAWQHLAVHIQLAASARNNMRVLRAKIKNQDRVVLAVDLLAHGQGPIQGTRAVFFAAGAGA